MTRREQARKLYKTGRLEDLSNLDYGLAVSPKVREAALLCSPRHKNKRLPHYARGKLMAEQYEKEMQKYHMKKLVKAEFKWLNKLSKKTNPGALPMTDDQRKTLAAAVDINVRSSARSKMLIDLERLFVAFKNLDVPVPPHIDKGTDPSVFAPVRLGNCIAIVKLWAILRRLGVREKVMSSAERKCAKAEVLSVDVRGFQNMFRFGVLAKVGKFTGGEFCIDLANKKDKVKVWWFSPGKVLNKLRQLFDQKPPSTKHISRAQRTRKHPSSAKSQVQGPFNLSMSLRQTDLEGEQRVDYLLGSTLAEQRQRLLLGQLPGE